MEEEILHIIRVHYHAAMTNMDLKLPVRPTLQDFQKYIKHMEEVRGFTKETVLEVSLLLVEEVGELCKAIRKAEGMQVDMHNSSFGDIGYEMADILMYLCSLANRYGIDLEKAFREKEEINKKRVWKKA